MIMVTELLIGGGWAGWKFDGGRGLGAQGVISQVPNWKFSWEFFYCNWLHNRINNK